MKASHTRWLLALALFCCLHCSSGYMHGDFITFYRRTQLFGERSPWKDVLGMSAPEFGLRKSVYLKDLEGREDTSYFADSEVKMQFSFDKDRFILPWISIRSRDGTVAKVIKIIFEHDGHSVTKVSHSTEYIEAMALTQRLPDGPVLVYEWLETRKTDPRRGLEVLLAIVWVVLAIGIGSAVLGLSSSTSFMEKRIIVIAPREQVAKVE